MHNILPFDIEAVIDRDLLDEEAECEFIRKDRKIPYYYFRPVSLVYVSMDSASGECSVGLMKGDDIAEQWWDLVRSSKHKHVITWGGNYFDLPLMEMHGLKTGTLPPDWIRLDAKPWDNPRHKMHPFHVDLCDAMANGGACPRMPQDVACKALGIPGKLGMSGADVEGAWEQRKHQEVFDYNAMDVMSLTMLTAKVVKSISWAEDHLLVESMARSFQGIGIGVGKWTEAWNKLANTGDLEKLQAAERT